MTQSYTDGLLAVLPDMANALGKALGISREQVQVLCCPDCYSKHIGARHPDSSVDWNYKAFIPEQLVFLSHRTLLALVSTHLIAETLSVASRIRAVCFILCLFLCLFFCIGGPRCLRRRR